MHTISTAAKVALSEPALRNLLFEGALTLVVALAVAISWCWPRLGDGLFGRVEKVGRRLAERKAASIVAAGALVILLRLILWPLLGIPIPRVHDEFANLLAADTFAHGRLTNPPHAMSVYFETFHVNQSPTYMSKYPPAQGAALALGQVLGHPWIGVLLTMACLCGSITWMLQGWMPARWALLGGVLAAARYGAGNIWMESYWGGAVAAIGGALVLGAFPRIQRHQRPQDAALFALGIAILANSRPFEGLVLCVPVTAALVWTLIKVPKGGWVPVPYQVAWPIVGILALTLAFMAYYNWRGTTNPMLMPYMVNDRTYFSSPVFMWGKLRPPLHYRNAQFAEFYNGLRNEWLADHLQWTWSGIKVGVLEKLVHLQAFYAPPQLGLPIMVSLLALPRSFKVRFIVIVCGVVAAAALTVTWFSPHYVAPFTAAVFALVIFGLRYIRCWKVDGRPVGVAVTRALVLVHLALVPVHASAVGFASSRGHVLGPTLTDRARLQALLESQAGEHLVIVRYTAQHDVNQEWVYNHADVDHAKVVWAREIRGLDLHPLYEYFSGRKIWLAEPDATPPRLSPYAESTSKGHDGQRNRGTSQVSPLLDVNAK